MMTVRTMANKLPTFQLVLTGGPGSLIQLNESERAYLIAVSEDDPPTTAYILYTALDYPARLKAQLRENLRRKNIQVIDQIEVEPAELEDIYANSTNRVGSTSADIDYERGLDSIRVLLARAVNENASDIHIVRRRRTASLSFRIDGRITPFVKWNEQMADQTCRFIYEVMGYDQEVTWNRNEPQDAVVDTVLPSGRRVRVRVGTIPASPDGYDMVLRILPGSGDSLRLAELGYECEQMQAIKSLIHRPSGLVVIAGGVGSGKSTSIVGMLHEELELHRGKLRIITVEDPPERVIPGATQVPVIRKRGKAVGDEFAFAIRGALRCDPDTLMVGEIRDLQSANLTIKFAQSGHRVYTTVHASTAIGIVSRMTGLGVDSSLLCTPDVLKGLIFQTLTPTLCAHCKLTASDWLKEHSGSYFKKKLSVDRMVAVLDSRGLDSYQIAYRSDRGCANCGGSGVSGRTLLAEFALPDDEMLSLLNDGKYIEAKRYWIKHCNGSPADEHGIRLISEGKASPIDVEWQIGLLNEKSTENNSGISQLNVTRANYA